MQESFSEEQLKAMPSSDGKTLGDKLALAIGSIGENMSLPRATRITVDPDTRLVGCCHPSTVEQDLPLGKYGAIVALKSHGPLTEVAKQLCVHVIGEDAYSACCLAVNVMCSLVHVDALCWELS